MKYLGFLVFLFIISLKICVAQETRLIYNCDGTDLLGNGVFNRRPLTRDDVNSYVDLYANTQVTTFMVCTGSDYFHYRSKYGRVVFDDNNGQLDCGDDTIRMKEYTRYYKNHLNLEKEGTDIIEASLQRAKEKGMEAFITYRMNDLHFNDTTTNCPLSYPDFWISHPEYWLNEKIDWHSAGAFDFSHQEVQEHKLDIITEQLERYGELIDGFDLDFMRFIVYFKKDEAVANAPLMTKLVQDIRQKIDKTARKYNKKILLSVRVPVDIEDCIEKGLDIQEWIRLGLIDFISIGVHWKGNPSIPVRKFKDDLGFPQIPVYTSIDDGAFSVREKYSHGMYRGMASHIFAEGGDGIYLFNFFFDDYMSKYDGHLNGDDFGQVCRIAAPELLNEMGSPETLQKRNKIYAFDDGASRAYGLTAKTPLPLKIAPDSAASVTVLIGDQLDEVQPLESILFLRTSIPADIEVYVNDKKVVIQKPDYVRLYDRNTGLGNDEHVYAYILPDFSLKHGNNKISITSDKSSLVVKRLEIALKYGDLTTNGYF